MHVDYVTMDYGMHANGLWYACTWSKAGMHIDYGMRAHGLDYGMHAHGLWYACTWTMVCVHMDYGMHAYGARQACTW